MSKFLRTVGLAMLFGLLMAFFAMGVAAEEPKGPEGLGYAKQAALDYTYPNGVRVQMYRSVDHPDMLWVHNNMTRMNEGGTNIVYDPYDGDDPCDYRRVFINHQFGWIETGTPEQYDFLAAWWSAPSTKEENFRWDGSPIDWKPQQCEIVKIVVSRFGRPIRVFYLTGFTPITTVFVAPGMEHKIVTPIMGGLYAGGDIPPRMVHCSLSVNRYAPSILRRLLK